MSFPPELVAFIQGAVRLRPDRLRRVDREWERLHVQRAAVAELVQSSKKVREDMAALRDYVLTEARRAVGERPDEQQIPEDIVEAVFPAARVLLLRKVLENSSDPKRGAGLQGLNAAIR